MHCISLQGICTYYIHSVKVGAWVAGTYDAYLQPVPDLAQNLLKRLQALALSGSEVHRPVLSTICTISLHADLQQSCLIVTTACLAWSFCSKQ